MMALGSVEAVIAAIREEARVEIDRIERDARAAADALRQSDAATPLVLADADARISAARRQAAERRAQEDWADRQSALNARESWIATIAEAGRRRLGARPEAERRLELLQLAREARSRIPEGDCRVLVAAADLPLADDVWRTSLAAVSTSHVEVAVASEIDSGCVVETIDGRIRFDNTYAARARRFESDWRHALGELFDRVAVHA